MPRFVLRRMPAHTNSSRRNPTTAFVSQSIHEVWEGHVSSCLVVLTARRKSQRMPKTFAHGVDLGKACDTTNPGNLIEAFSDGQARLYVCMCLYTCVCFSWWTGTGCEETARGNHDTRGGGSSPLNQQKGPLSFQRPTISNLFI